MRVPMCSNLYASAVVVADIEGHDHGFVIFIMQMLLVCAGGI